MRVDLRSLGRRGFLVWVGGNFEPSPLGLRSLDKMATVTPVDSCRSLGSCFQILLLSVYDSQRSPPRLLQIPQVMLSGSNFFPSIVISVSSIVAFRIFISRCAVRRIDVEVKILFSDACFDIRLDHSSFRCECVKTISNQ